MDRNSTAVRLRQSDAVDDRLMEVLRVGARQLVKQPWIGRSRPSLTEPAALRLPDGRARLVRNGHTPEREVQTRSGAVAVSHPKVRASCMMQSISRRRRSSVVPPSDSSGRCAP